MNKKIQILRGLAIIAVITIHTVGGGIAVAVRPCVNFAVALFIFISGYLNGNVKPVNSYQAVRKRIERVTIPYIIWSIVYTLLFENINDLCINLVTAKASYQLYYVFVYIQLVLITPFLLKITNKVFQYFILLLQPISILLLRYILPCMGMRVDGYICSLYSGSVVKTQI